MFKEYSAFLGIIVTTSVSAFSDEIGLSESQRTEETVKR